MNTPVPEAQNPPSYLSWGVIVFLSLFAVLSIAWISLRSGPGEVERILEDTAVGDLDYFVAPKKLAPGDELAHYHGKALKAGGTDASELDETKLYRVGQIDEGQSFLYTVREHAGKPADQAPVLYLKVGPSKFLRLAAP